MKKSMILVELAGPAGAGKSTLTKALMTEYDQEIRISEFPSIRETKKIPFFVWNALLLLPTFITFFLTKTDRAISSSQMASMAILNGWDKQFTRNLAEQKIVVFDQGPVYKLAELLIFGPENFRSIAFTWWDRVCKNWADVLDVVICLDTLDSILMERIRARDKNHGIKENTDQWAVQFLAQYRQAQHEVLNSLTNKDRGPKLIRIDTSQKSLNEVVEDIFALLVKKD